MYENRAKNDSKNFEIPAFLSSERGNPEQKNWDCENSTIFIIPALLLDRSPSVSVSVIFYFHGKILKFKIISVVFYPLFLCIYIIPWQCRQIISFELVMFNCIIKKRRRRWPPLNFEIVGGISAFHSRGQWGQKR